MALTSLSSSSTTNAIKHEVFLSFRGDDTRNNFTSHLHHALCRRKIDVFIDDTLRRGDEISPSLLKAIEASKISIIILSKHYASSSSCLDELVKILECQKINDQIVFPIFYNVDPSDVRNQRGSFNDAFVVHQKRLRGDAGKLRVARWRAALTQVASLSGWVSDVERLESKFIENIVKAVLKTLKHMSSYDSVNGLVGIVSHIEKVDSLLCIETEDFRIMGIWGMSGVGKTTLARTIFNRIANHFESSCFLANIREECDQFGLNYLQKKLFSEILEEQNEELDAFTIKRLYRKKILIVLDDVNSAQSLKYLIGDHSWYGPGSRIIIVSRDRQVLKDCVDELYELKELNYHNALQLFSLNAFKQSYPREDYMALSNRVVCYAKGNPLALKVLGCFLQDRSKQEWKSSLNKLKKCPNLEIQNILRISYDELDDQEKEIFLAIACFCKGEHKDHVIAMLDGEGLFTEIGISVLVDKCLLTVIENKLLMHDLIQEMGQSIVLQESIKESEKRTRLWDPQYISNILKKNRGMNTVEGISLDLSQINELHLNSNAFVSMAKLKFLKFYSSDYNKNKKENDKVHLHQGLELLPDELRYLHWHRYPLPPNFNPENLVELQMLNSKVEHLWKENQHLEKLRNIDLIYSQHLIEGPNLYRASNLQTMVLNGCSRLTKFPEISWNIKELLLDRTAIEEFPSAIGCCNQLVKLKPAYCKRLNNLPLLELSLKGCTSITSSIGNIESLIELQLSDCSKLVQLPENVGYCSKLVPNQRGRFTDAFVVHQKRVRGIAEKVRVARWRAALTQVACLSESVSTWREPEEKNTFLDVACFFKGEEDKGYVAALLGDCHYSSSVFIDKSLITLADNKLQMHDLLQQMGHEIVRRESSDKPGNRSRLWEHEDIYSILTNDTGTAEVEGISLDMSKTQDVELNSSAFKRMRNLRCLKFYDETPRFGESEYISKVLLPYSLDYLSNELSSLHWLGCPLEELPSNFNLKNVVELSLPGSKLKRLWTGEKHAPKLKWLNLSNSRNLTELPDFSQVLNLEGINLEYNTNLLGIPRSIGKLYNLTILSLKGCENIRSFPDNIYFKSLISLDLSQCINLTKFPQMSGDMMEKLYLSGTAIEEVPSSIESLAKLVELHLQRCTMLKSLSTRICKLKSLAELNLSDCCRLESFPEILETMEALIKLDLSGTAIKEIDSSIELLKGLSTLFLNCCENLGTLPSSICNIESLIELQLSDCSKLVQLPENAGNLKFLKIFLANRAGLCQLPSSLTSLKNLETLDCSECRSLEFPPVSVLLRSLRKLSLNGCTLTNISPDIGCLSSLEVLELCGNDFESLPKSIKQLSRLKTLALNKCSKLLRLSALPLALQELKAMNCKQLRSLPDSSQFEQLLTERCTREDPFSMRLVFTNCLELNQKSFDNFLAELQLMIRLMATTSPICCQKGCQKAVDVSICLPGSEIPKWFIYQSAGSSVDIPLSSLNWGDSRFTGFALCAVTAFEENYDDCRGLRVNYKCSFETNDGDKFDFINSLPVCDDDVKSVESDHVIIGYDVYSDVKLPVDKFTTGSFEFFPEKDYGEPVPGCRVKYCGVCPIHEKPNISVETNDTTSQDFEETFIGSDGEDVEQRQIVPESKLMALGNKFVFHYSSCRNKVVIVLFYLWRFIFYLSSGLRAFGMSGFFLLNLFILYKHFFSTDAKIMRGQHCGVPGIGQEK